MTCSGRVVTEFCESLSQVTLNEIDLFLQFSESYLLGCLRFQQRLTLTAFLEARRGEDKQDPEGHDGEVDNEKGSQGKFLIDLGSLIRIKALF